MHLALAPNVGDGLFGLEEPQEEHPEERFVAAASLRLALGEPPPDLGQSGLRDRIRLSAPGAFLGLFDQTRFLEPSQLGVYLAVARRPDVAERSVEGLRQVVAAH